MKEKIIEFLREACALEENDITLETKLQDLSLDSLSFIEVIVNIEQEFDIEFGEEKLNIYEWEKIEDLLSYAEREINGIQKN